MALGAADLPALMATAVLDRELRIAQADAGFAGLLARTPEQLPDQLLADFVPELALAVQQVCAEPGTYSQLTTTWPGCDDIPSYVVIAPIRSRRGVLVGCDLAVYRSSLAPQAGPAAQPAGAPELRAIPATLATAIYHDHIVVEEGRAPIDALIASAPIGLAFFDAELRFQQINPQLAAMHGLAVEDHVGCTLREVVPSLADAAEPLLRQVLTSGEPVLDVEIVGETPATPGQPRIWRESFFPVHDASGQLLGVGLIATEITEYRRMSAALRASEAREQARADELATVLAAVPVAVWIAQDPESRVITGNPSAHALLRVPRGNNLSKTAPESERPTHFRVFKDGAELAPEELPVQLAAAHGVEVRDFEEQLVFDDGTTLTLLGNATPLLDALGQPRGAVAAFLDISERKQAELERSRLLAEAEAARAAAEAAVRIRDSFVSVAAHELKTPLTSLMGQAQLLERRALRDQSLSERDRRTVGVIISQAQRLNQMISALLDISRIERGLLTLERDEIDLTALVRRVVEEVQPTLINHRLFCTFAREPLLINGDALRLEQVLQNLIGNAVKYSPRGGTVRLHAARNGQGVRIDISDQGIGIPDSALPHLFQRFYRADNADASRISGMGIGLFVVREIVSLHGGSVQVSSVEGQGSTFSVLLPDVE